MNDSALNFDDLLLPHLPSNKIGHMTSDTRPSCFIAYNIEKLGMGLGDMLLPEILGSLKYLSNFLSTKMTKVVGGGGPPSPPSMHLIASSPL